MNLKDIKTKDLIDELVARGAELMKINYIKKVRSVYVGPSTPKMMI